MGIQEYLRRARARKAKRREKAVLLFPLGRPGAAGRKDAKRSGRRALVKSLDTLFSLFIRARDKARFGGLCPFVHSDGRPRPIECCFHFITRSKFSVRWNPLNAVGSCFGCNVRYEHDQLFVESVLAYARGLIGALAWDALKLESNRVANFSTADLEAIRAGLKTQLAENKTVEVRL